MQGLAKRLNILVVDDDGDIRKWVEASLLRMSHRITLAEGVFEAMELLRSHNFDLIISDLRMNGEDGIDLLTNVRRINWTSPKFILFTSHADLPHEMALDLGANDVLPKPCSERELVECVLSVFKDIHARDEVSDEERDKKFRVRTSLDADVTIEGESQARVAKVLNIAKGGMFLCFEHTQPQVNALVSLRVQFSSSPKRAGYVFQARGLVRWSRLLAAPGQPSGFGIQFLELSQSDLSFLERFIESEKHLEMQALEGGTTGKKIA